MAHDYPELVGKAWVNGDLSEFGDYYYVVLDTPSSSIFYRDSSGTNLTFSGAVTQYKVVGTSLTLYSTRTANTNVYAISRVTAGNVNVYSDVNKTSVVFTATEPAFVAAPAFVDSPMNITLADAKLGASYTSNTWVSPPWTFNANSFPSIQITLNPPVPYDFVLPAIWDNKATSITNAQSRTEAHYSGNTWNMGGVWGITEGISRPILLRVSGTAIVDPALTSRKVYVFVEEDPTGSLFHNGKIYKSLRKSESFASVTGVNGAFITHYYGGDILRDSAGNSFDFLFSGVQDPARPGGYGDIQEGITSRRVPFLTDRSNNVVFYYGMLPPVPYDRTTSISTPLGVIDLALYIAEKSNVRIIMSDGQIVTAGLTLTDAFDATKLRIMTASGVRAFIDASKASSDGTTQGEIDLTNEQGSDYEAPPPQTTGNVAPSNLLIVTASTTFGAGYEADNVYDGLLDSSNSWFGNGTNGSLTSELTKPLIVNTARLLSADGRAKAFSVEASNDNSTWIALGSFIRAQGTSNVWQEFSFSNVVAYKFYRISFSGALYSGSNISLTELELVYN